MRRRWPVPVFFVVLAASVAYNTFGPKISPVTGPAYALYTVALQADRAWSLLALAAAEAAVVVNGAGIGVNVTLATTGKSSAVSAAFIEATARAALAETRSLLSVTSWPW